MRWQKNSLKEKPQEGSCRPLDCFLILPLTLKVADQDVFETRWLEFARVWQEYRDRKWIDKEWIK